MLEECLASRVRSEQRSWEKATEGSHCQNQPTLPLHHAWRNQLSDPQRTKAVDSDDILHLFRVSKNEWDWDGVAKSDVVDKNGNVHSLDDFL